MIITYAQMAFDEEIMPDASRMAIRIAAFVTNIERLLGAERGSFAYVMKLFQEIDDEK